MSQRISISNRDLADYWIAHQKNSDKVLEVIVEDFNLQSLPGPSKVELENNVKNHCRYMKIRWIKRGRCLKGLQADPWYSGVAVEAEKLILVRSVLRAKKIGRPIKPFAESGDKSRHLKSIKSTSDVPELEILHRASLI